MTDSPESAPETISENNDPLPTGKAGLLRNLVGGVGLIALGVVLTISVWPRAHGRSNAGQSTVVSLPDTSTIGGTSLNGDRSLLPPNVEMTSAIDPGPDVPTEEGITVADLAGRWVLKGSISRDVTMRTDGTATMDVKLDFFSGLIYGSEMKLQIRWRLEDGFMTHTIISGTPKENVDRLVKDFGGTRRYRVIELSETTLVLEEESETKTQYRWTRAAVPSADAGKMK